MNIKHELGFIVLNKRGKGGGGEYVVFRKTASQGQRVYAVNLLSFDETCMNCPIQKLQGSNGIKFPKDNNFA